MKTFNFIDKIQNELYLKGGFSYNQRDGFNPPPEGYMVGGIGEELIFDSIEALSKGKKEILILLERYGSSKGFLYLGGWKAPDGKVHIEPSELFYTKDVASIVAKNRNQRAIYDLEEEEDILIKGEKE